MLAIAAGYRTAETGGRSPITRSHSRPVIPLRDRLQADLSPALRTRDQVRVRALRSTLAAIANAEAVDAGESVPGSGLWSNEVERRLLDEGAVAAIVVAERDRLRSLAEEMAAVGQHDEATSLTAQAAVLDEHLDGVGGHTGS